MNKPTVGFAAAGLLGLLIVGAAHAASVTYYLNQTNVDPIMPDGIYDYLSVTITDGVTYGLDTNAVRFDVTILGAMPASGGGAYGIDSFTWNFVPSNPADGTIVGLPSGWSGNWRPPPNPGDGFGMFDGGVDDTGNPQSPTLTFYISGVTGDTIADYYDLSTSGAAQGNSHFSAHVRGFVDQDPAFCDDGYGNDTCLVTSAWFGDGEHVTIVPVPAAVWLFGSALGLFGWIRRRAV